MSEDLIKMVICMRNDLNMRKGKIAAMAGHGAISFLTHRLTGKENKLNLTEEQISWCKGAMTKICVQVNSEEELLEIDSKAKLAGVEVHVITDSGKTEFNGVPTKTCLALGPAVASVIDNISGHLKLY